MQKSNQAFTLIELVIVVLIIGILAAIAVPQYQLSVMKSQYTELKIKARALANAMHLYYLANGSYATSLSKLDIDLPITRERTYTDSFYIDFKDGSTCEMYFTDTNHNTICSKTMHGTNMRYIFEHFGRYKLCEAYSTDTQDRFNRLCQNETGKTAPNSCSNRCTYSY